MRILMLVVGLFGASALPNTCIAQIFDDPFSQYFERGITIAPGAGNAKDANAAIHTIDPWPPYAGDTRIPGNGQAAVRSIGGMYSFPNPFLPQQPGFGQGPSGGNIGAGVGGAGAAVGIGSVTGGGSPMQPVSSGGY
jgi:hypothetical protein